MACGHPAGRAAALAAQYRRRCSHAAGTEPRRGSRFTARRTIPVEVVFRGADRGIQGGEEQTYARSLTTAAATGPDVLLAYEMNGHALEPQHGFPLRLIAPGWYGMTSVKWLSSIEAVMEPFESFQQAVAYRYQQDADDPGDPVARTRVRALMIPRGIPDFFSRRRFADAGRIALRGRA